MRTATPVPPEAGRDPLDRYANNFSPPPPPAADQGSARRPSGAERRARNRRQQHELREIAAKVVGGRTARCGQKMLGPTVMLNRAGDGSHHYRGLETCGSVWCCPYCAAKIAEGRRREIDHVLKAHRDAGGTTCLATLTIPHHAFHTCRELRKAVARAWSLCKGGKGWQTARSRHGLFGNIRALEVTHGENGWHPHLHVLILFKPGTTERDIATFSAWLYKRWASRVRHLGFGDCAPGAFTFVIVDDHHGAAGYLAKWGAPHEMTKAHAKRGRGGRTPWQILADCADGNARDIALFRDYAAAFKRARQLTWSRGLRKHYALETETPDEALADQDPEPTTPIAAFTRPLWKKILKTNLSIEVLIAADHGSVAGIKVLLQRYTIPTSIRFQLSHDGQNMIMIFGL